MLHLPPFKYFVINVFLLYSVKGENTAFNYVPAYISSEISFMFYYGPTLEDYITIPYEKGITILEQATYNKSMDTVFYLHGWSERPSVRKNFSTDIMAAAFLKAQVANFVIVNYENLVQHYYNITSWTPSLLTMGAGYVNAVHNASLIGTGLGRFFEHFVEHCSCYERLHIIGFSLGAQIMSYAAINYGQGRLKRLTALDAAGPIFEIPGHSSLSKNDAVFVDVIHTDGGKFGYLSNIGTVDFFPNFGIAPQPHCTAPMPLKCSHYMSVEYYAESVLDAKGFVARSCSNIFTWTMSMCNDNDIQYMGYYVNLTAKGNYFLNTNPNPPYGNNEKNLNVQS